MILKKIFTSAFFMKVIFSVSLFILIFISAITYKHTLALRDSTSLVVHSYQVKVELLQLFNNLKDAETEQRGFIITHDSIFLKPFKETHHNVDRSLATLRQLITDNVKQQKNLELLNQLVDLRYILLVNLLDESTEVVHEQSTLNKNLLKGKEIMDDINFQINKMIDLEIVLLKNRQLNYEHEIPFTPMFTLVLMIFSLLVFIFSYYKINNDYRRLIRNNNRLLITTESFKDAEKTGEFSSWHLNITTNEFICSDNHYLLLGCGIQSFKASVENFREFIHPNDKQLFSDSINQIIKSHTTLTFFYRVIRTDGTIRYFKSIGKIITDFKGNNILICINNDITEQYINSISLEERNKELEQINKELASFNHMASHDLQEPLRKIQTFISRISDKEINNLSDTGKEYFSRIQSAAGRMRLLIDDLLLFSRTTKADSGFEESDLNVLLENAKQDLAQTIEEKRAIINSEILPELKVIPFQIQQLFINLLGNSLKYSKKNVTPVIQIEYKKVSAGEFSFIKTGNTTAFHKISVSDNGLGFEKVDAENIFKLFYRLHHKDDYPGTGIGLAICKKIIENHNGYIIADGKNGEGSKFTFFLPA